MARLTREESRVLTRERLLASATELFGRDGYATTSVERIAEEAGFSKGAVYSNFDSKEAIFLTVLDQQGQQSLDPLVAAIEATSDAATIVSCSSRGPTIVPTAASVAHNPRACAASRCGRTVFAEAA